MPEPIAEKNISGAFSLKRLPNFNKTFTKLVCIFHGGRCGAQLPIFRGYNYFFKDTIVLSISDPLYSIYNDINMALKGGQSKKCRYIGYN